VSMTSLPVFTKIGPKSVQFHGVTSGCTTSPGTTPEAAYKLGVEEGDWVEYSVVEAGNWEVFGEIHSGDKLRFKVVGTRTQERMDPYRTVVFEVEAPVCDT